MTSYNYADYAAIVIPHKDIKVIVRKYIVEDAKTKFEDTKGVTRIRKSKKDRQLMQWTKEKGQKDKQWSIKHYTEN